MISEVLYIFAGFIILLKILEETPQILQLIRSACLRLLGINVDLKKRYGNWAVVTGASDGIGKSYSTELAKRGINIVLIARNQKKLQGVAKDLEDKYKVETKIIVADFSVGQEIYPKIQQGLKGIDIGILVNNVGLMSDRPKPISELTDSDVYDNLNVNVASAINLTRIVLPKLIVKNSGAIVNVSSYSCTMPVPNVLLYSASKAYITNFSEGLREELRNTNITVQTLIPFQICSNLNDYDKLLKTVTYLTPSSDEYAAEAIKTLGREDCTTGYNSHRILFGIFRLLPLWYKFELASGCYKVRK